MTFWGVGVELFFVFFFFFFFLCLIAVVLLGFRQYVYCT